MEVNQGRTTSAFPHCGRTFACDDVMGVTDVRLSSDAYQAIVENGIPFVSAAPSGLNWGNKYSYGNQSDPLVLAPVVGCASHLTGFMSANIDNPKYTIEAVGELRGDFDGFSVNLCVRFMTQEEYGELGPTYSYTTTGNGYRGQRIRVQVQNHAIQVTYSVYTLIDIFVDYNWYSANVATLPAINSAINTIDLTTTTIQGLNLGEILNLHIVGNLPANLLRYTSCQASAYFRYEIPKAADGTAWGVGNCFPNDGYGTPYVNPKFDESLNPMIGMNMGGCGIIGCDLRTYWTGRDQVPTGVAGGTGGSRVVTPYYTEAASPLPIMGGPQDALVYSRLRDRGSSAIGASWPALSMMSRRVGGVLKPIVGHSGVFTENIYGGGYDESRYLYIQAPHGATRLVMIAIVRTIAGAGIHTVQGIITNSAGTSSQTVLNTTNASGTGYRYVYLDTALNVAMRPTGGLVERYTLRLRSTKSSPRGTQVVSPYLADGIIAFYLAFYQ